MAVKDCHAIGNVNGSEIAPARHQNSDFLLAEQKGCLLKAPSGMR